MFKLFRKKSNKKGFTLAELLIVVAIIAVLVAIAIPIFMNSLAKAEKAAEAANIRSVKAAAINKILNDWDTAPDYMGYSTYSSSAKTLAKAWDVDATVKNGDITECKVTPVTSAGHASPEVTKTEDGDHYNYKIVLSITDTQVTKPAAGSP